MVLQQIRVSQNFSRFSWVSHSRFSAVVCDAESRFFAEVVSKSRFFDQQICLGVLIFGLLFAAFDRLCGS